MCNSLGYSVRKTRIPNSFKVAMNEIMYAKGPVEHTIGIQ